MPKDKTKLICDKNHSLICFEDIILPPIKKGLQETIEIELNIPKELPFDIYKLIIYFNVNEKNYGEKIVLMIHIVSELNAFKKFYDLNDNIFSDRDIIKALKQKINWEEAFNYLIKEIGY